MTFALFEACGKHAKGGSAGGSGTTGLPNAGVVSDVGKTLKHWREIAGLTDDDSNNGKKGAKPCLTASHSHATTRP